MYLWLKRLFYGCEHEWVFLTKFNTYEYSDSKRPLKDLSKQLAYTGVTSV